MKKLLKYFTFLFILALLLIIGATGFLTFSNNKNIVTEEEVREFQSSDQIINNPQSGFSKLSPEEQAAYVRISNEIENFNPEFYLTGNNVTEDQFNRIMNLILKDHPEYFYIKNYEYYKNSDNIVEKANINFTSDTETIQAQQLEVDNWKNSILSQITPEMNNYDVAKFIHDYIINTTEYDPTAPNNQNILSVVENQRSVCAGYSKAYQYLLNQAGIFATYASGQANVGPHAWNLIQLDGEYGWVDVTWDDPSFIGNDQPENFLSHEYFGISSEDLSKSRTFDQTYETFDTYSLPTFNYYIREGSYFDLSNPGSYAQFVAKLIEARAQGAQILEVRVANLEQVDELLTQLSFDPILFEGSINYITDQINPSITFLLQ